MYNSTPPTKSDLPSTAKLIKSTILAALAASVLLVTVVMPAEYGIDPTGIGKITGLKKMGAIKTSLAKDAAAERAKEQEIALSAEKTQPIAPVVTTQTAIQATILTHEKTFILAPDAWTEIKLKMAKGDKANYVWFTDGRPANFDTHADSKPLDIDYHSYAKGTKQRDDGILEAAFDGSHGWFWRNRSGNPMTIVLQTKGEYTDITVMN